jgi:hypothetical protein
MPRTQAKDAVPDQSSREGTVAQEQMQAADPVAGRLQAMTCRRSPCLKDRVRMELGNHNFDRSGFGSSPEISMSGTAVMLRSLLILLRLLVLRGSAVGLSICDGRQRERADAEDERGHDGRLDLGHLSSPTFRPRVSYSHKGFSLSRNLALDCWFDKRYYLA